MIGWLLYSMLVAALLALAAAALEAGLRLRGRPTRWVWALALAGSIVIPLAERYAPSFTAIPRVDIVMTVPMFGSAGMSSPDAGQAQEASKVSGADLVLAGWIAGSSALLVLLGVSAIRLRRARMDWERRSIDRTEVWVSDDVGPAVLGVVRPDIVIPDWALGLPTPLRRLMLLHETEHLRTGDSRLLLAGFLTVAVAPWNIFLWWQLHHLRLAVELDCDRRVLLHSAGESASVADYGRLLLEVGRRRSRMIPVAVGTAGTGSSLELRLRELLRDPRRGNMRRVSGFAALGVALATLAVCSPDLNAPGEQSDDAQDGAPAVVEKEDVPEQNPRSQRQIPHRLPPPPVYPDSKLQEAPAFTPREVGPRLANREDVQQALATNFPTELKDAGIGGTVVLWLFIDAGGTVLESRIKESSGHDAIDNAALEVADVMEYEPARNRGEAVPVWVQTNITFSAT